MYLNEQEIEAIMQGQIRGYLEAVDQSIKNPTRLRQAPLGSTYAQNDMIVEVLEDEECGGSAPQQQPLGEEPDKEEEPMGLVTNEEIPIEHTPKEEEQEHQSTSRLIKGNPNLEQAAFKLINLGSLSMKAEATLEVATFALAHPNLNCHTQEAMEARTI